MKDFKLDFVGAGAARAGTTWLAQCLREHPQVCFSKEKELNFFCTTHNWRKLATNYQEGNEWLESKFSHHKSGQIRGEITPSYLADPCSPKLIKERFPDARILISYRNPTEALYSHYHQVAKHQPVPSSFEGFLEEHSEFIQQRFYHTHTLRFLEQFPASQIHFILYDDISTNPAKVIVELFSFLQVAADYVPPSLNVVVNERKAPRSLFVRNAIGGVREWMNSDPKLLPLRRFVRLVRLHDLGDWIQKKNLRPGGFPPMKSETRARLLSTYTEENLKLGSLLERDLSHWNR